MCVWAVVYLRLSSGEGKKEEAVTPLSLSPLAGLYTRFHQFHYRPLLNNKPDLTHSLPSLSLTAVCVCVSVSLCACVCGETGKKKEFGTDDKKILDDDGIKTTSVCALRVGFFRVRMCPVHRELVDVSS